MELKCSPQQPFLYALLTEDNFKILHAQKNTKLWKNLDQFQLPRERQVVKCMEWSPSKTYNNNIIVGLNSGRVILYEPESEKCFNNKKEFIPRCPRSCTALSWNCDDPKLIACGMDRHRSDCSLLIYDIMNEDGISPVKSKLLGTDLHMQNPNLSLSPKFGPTKSYVEFGYAEAVNSVLWLRKEPHSLLAGMNTKNLRMFDIRTASRSNSQSAQSVSTKAVYGLCQDPFLDKRLATFFESQVFIWDTRNFTKPAAIINEIYNVVKIAWCPSRSGFIATLGTGCAAGNANTIFVYDMKHAVTAGSDRPSDIAYYPIEQTVCPVKKDNVVSTFAWHEDKSSPNVIVSACKNETLISSVAFERIAISWTNHVDFVATINGHNHICKQKNKDIINPQDILIIMKERALNGYGIQDGINHFTAEINLEPDNKPLKYFWEWIKKANTQKLKSQDYSRQNIPQKGNPVAKNYSTGLFKLLKSNMDSVAETFYWTGIPNVTNIIFNSSARDQALSMCDWSSLYKLQKDDNRQAFKKQLLKEQNFQRAAAIALWHMDMKLAIDILNNQTNQSNELALIAMAFSGFTGEQKSSPLWKEMCASLQKTLSDPYLRASCMFLNNQPNSGLVKSYQVLLHDSDIKIKDRVAFACVYLNDDQLEKYLERLSVELIDSGNLGGILVTGLDNKRGIDLLESYVDRTKDVQTGILSIVQMHDPTILKNQIVQMWLEEYKILLNSWEYWQERSVLQMVVGKTHSNHSVKKDAIAHCNFCQKTLNETKYSSRGRGFNLPLHNINACAKCQKPLPRCSLCALFPGKYSSDKYTSKLLTWCQICRHSGHSEHLEEWFKDHLSCPVSGCNCKCLSQ